MAISLLYDLVLEVGEYKQRLSGMNAIGAGFYQKKEPEELEIS